MQVQFHDWGLIDYNLAWDRQEALFQDGLLIKKSNRDKPSENKNISNNLIFCEHPHVFTIGKSGIMDHLLLNREELKNKKISFYKNNRGGDITYHGPGQVVGYPILDLEQWHTDIVWYMRTLEQVMIDTLAEFNICGMRSPGETGVWLDINTAKARKICAFGVRTSRWMTMHGWALNVNTNLQYFNYIIPCGIVDKGVTSMQNELGYEINMSELKLKLLNHFEQNFHCKITHRTSRGIGQAIYQ